MLYLILPIILATAFVVPAGDALLQATGFEPTGGAKFLTRAITGLLIFVAVYLVFIGIRRIGRD
jgi:hypothetical protein